MDVNAVTLADGASITAIAGVGAAGPDYTAFANLYLNPANQADPNTPLQAQPGKVVQTFQDQLLTFLQTNEGYKATRPGRWPSSTRCRSSSRRCSSCRSISPS